MKPEQSPTPTAAPWDRPAELERALRGLEILWREAENPIYVWQAMRQCLTWLDGQGNIAGPFQFPNWVLRYLLRVAVKVQDLAMEYPPLENKTAAPKILNVLGFSQNTRQMFGEWFRHQREVGIACIADGAKARGHSVTEIHQKLAEIDGLGLRPRRDEANGETGARSVERLVARGRTRWRKWRSTKL